MTTTTIFTREQAKASDAKLVELQDVAYVALDKMARATDNLRHTVGDRKQGWGRDARWTMTKSEAVAKAAEIAANDTTYVGRAAGEALARYSEAADAYIAASDAATKQGREWRENGMWSRFLVVPGGHIHTNDGCFTLRADTRTAWLPELSGDTEADAVEVYGEVLCSHCYPSAPVAWQGGKTVTDSKGRVLTKVEQAAAKDAKAAEKAAKDAAKAASEVRDIHSGRLLYKTVRGATNAVASDLDSAIWYGPTHPSYKEWIELLDQVSAALAAKHGRDAAEVRAELVAKAEKKAKAKLGGRKSNY
jgi:hypothetical protein